MALRFSTGLKDSVLVTGSLRAAINNAQLLLYSGAAPATADAAATGTLLNTYVENDTGTHNLTFESSTSNGALVKTAAQTWSGTSVAAGTAGYFRLVVTGDDGTLSTTQVRIQGTVGNAGADLYLASTTIANATLYYIDAFAIAIPDL